MIIHWQGGEIIIRVPDNIDIQNLQRLMNNLTYNKLMSESQAKQNEIGRSAPKSIKLVEI